MASKSKTAPFARYLEKESASLKEVIAQVYGPLPGWMPEPVLLQLDQAISALRNAGQSTSRIVEIVTQARRDALVIPDSVREVGDFIKSANYLAHVQWALSLGKVRGIEELAGKAAACGEKRSDQLRSFLESGNKAKKAAAAANDAKWTKIGKPLRVQHPDISDLWMARQIAKESGDKVSTIRAALGRLGLSKKNNC